MLLTIVRFVCAVSGNTSTPTLFRSYRELRGTSSLYNFTKIWEAARATSAAPTFFDPIKIGPTQRPFGDGSMGANNPIYELWNEAIDICNSEPLDQNLTCLVSIGAGVPNLKKFGSSVRDVVESISCIAVETEITANNFIRSHPELSSSPQRYFRFNTPRGLADIGLDEASEIGVIEDITDVYLREENTFNLMRQCVKRLTGDNSGPTHNTIIVVQVQSESCGVLA